MTELRTALTLLFKRVSPDRMLRYYSDENVLYRKCYAITEIISNRTIRKALLESHPYYSLDEVENIFKIVDVEYGRKSLYAGNKGPKDGDATVFNLLNTYTQDVLNIEKNVPVVKYEKLLSWRELALQLGEDILTCSFAAFKDSISSHRRTFFAWSPIISNDNIRLRNLLSNGLAENHFHLKGSAPYFEISWVALMNRIKERKLEFNELLKDDKLDPDIQYGNEEDADIYILCIKAAYIRLLLFQLLHYNDFTDDFLNVENIQKLLSASSSIKESKLLFNYRKDLQIKIDSFRFLFGLEFKEAGGVSVPDYAITKDMEEYKSDANILLCGERSFLYDCFFAIEQNDVRIEKYIDLFYAYLIIKERLRKEFIQVNSNVGFRNFQKYQDRKSLFLNKREIYKTKMSELATNSTIKNQHLKFVEARLVPNKDKNTLASSIKECDEASHPLPNNDALTSYAVNSSRNDCSNCLNVEKCLEEGKVLTRSKYCADFKSKNEKLFYVLHFIKGKERISKIDIVNEVQCRDHYKRKEVKQQAMAIDALLCSQSPYGKRIIGIDAASSELDNRPETFAQAFRFLKGKRDKGVNDHLKRGLERPFIRATYHVGEDFYDVVDGLRAIDESIKFLNLTEGDRIGHALALGIDVREFYESKHYCLLLPQQWHLDNLCWLLSRINRYNLQDVSTFCQYLRWEFQTLFMKVYNGTDDLKKGINPELYYDAWRLRGDDPFLYNSEGSLKAKFNLTYWDKSGLNEIYPYKGCMRTSEDLVNKLYFNYHFNSDVKKEGEKIIRFEVKKEYVKLVEAVQRCFQEEVKSKHLGIEMNPSSNVRIGTFKRYDKHPLIKLFNLGLETDPEKIRKCPQLFVSINTDDQGVFNTYLENEYALMAIALEKMEDENGKKLYNPAMIYDWLDRIRAMGLEMRFGKD